MKAALAQVVEEAVGERPAALPAIVAALAGEERIVPFEPSELEFFELLEEVADSRVVAR